MHSSMRRIEVALDVGAGIDPDLERFAMGLIGAFATRSDVGAELLGLGRTPRVPGLRRPSRVRSAWNALVLRSGREATAHLEHDADVVHLAVGRAGLRTASPQLLSVPGARVLEALTDRSRSELRRRAARVLEQGGALHALCREDADAFSALWERSHDVRVIPPGVEAMQLDAKPRSDALEVVVLDSREPGADDALRAALGAVSYIAVADRPSRATRCICLAAPPHGYPFEAISAMLAGLVVVGPAHSTMIEGCGGIATLLHAPSTSELCGVAVELARSDAAQSLAKASGPARAPDLGWDTACARVLDLYATLERQGAASALGRIRT